MTKYIFIFSTLLFCFSSWGQLKKTLADKHFENLAYYDAAPMYEELADRYLTKKKGTKEDVLRAAISHGKIFQFKTSNKYYEAAYKEDVSLLTEKHWMDFINQLRMMGAYQKSKQMAEIASGKFKKNNYFETIVTKGLDIEYIFLDSTLNKIQKMPFNSDMGDFAPFIYDGGIVFTTKAENPDILAGRYAWDHGFFTNVVYTEPKNEGWTSPKVLKKQYHSRKHDGPVAFDQKEEKMVITHNYSPKEKKDGMRYLALYFSEKNAEGEWSELKAFPHDTKNSNTGHGCFSPDGNRLYFVSDRENGKGKTDIYYSDFKLGEWQAPINLGNANTEGDEMFPFVSKENLLYFASTGHLGLGGLDVFMLDLNQPNAKPVNMGGSINTAADDFGLVTDSTGKSGYFSSDREEFVDRIYSWERKEITIELEGEIYAQYDEKEPLLFEKILLINTSDGDTTTLTSDGFGDFKTKLKENKTYLLNAEKKHFKLEHLQELKTQGIQRDSTLKTKLVMLPTTITVHLFVVEAENNTPLSQSKVAVRQLDKLMDTTLITDERGKVSLEVDRFEKYWTFASKKGYIDDEARFQTESKSGKEISLTLELPKIKLGSKFKLENIFYDYNKATLREESREALDKLADFILSNEIKIELSSHTDARGSDSYNKNLSQRRAQSCVDYLIEKGVSKSKIIAKGYGESKLVNHCKNGVKCSEDEHQENRRTEVKILEL